MQVALPRQAVARRAVLRRDRIPVLDDVQVGQDGRHPEQSPDGDLLQLERRVKVEEGPEAEQVAEPILDRLPRRVHLVAEVHLRPRHPALEAPLRVRAPRVRRIAVDLVRDARRLVEVGKTIEKARAREHHAIPRVNTGGSPPLQPKPEQRHETLKLDAVVPLIAVVREVLVTRRSTRVSRGAVDEGDELVNGEVLVGQSCEMRRLMRSHARGCGD